ncbi:MAG: flagellar motor switch protein FliN [Fibrobacteres bacterium]|nr:flagellar motor switch protein FliN [Fibrobacterota bacterium]
MSSDLLSQDDIDALIQSEAGGSSGGGGGGAGGGINTDLLKKPVNMIGEQISTVLLTVLGKDISVTVNNIAPSKEGQLAADFGSDSLMLRADLFQKLSGAFYFAYKKADVATLADLMMMGDGSASYEEDHKDAIVELTNQILGAVSSSFGSNFDAQITVATPTVEDFSPDAAGFNPSQSIAAYCTMKVEDVKSFKFAILFPNNTASEMADLAAAKGGGGALGGSSGMGGGGGGGSSFDFADLGGGASEMQLQNFAQPSGNLATDRSTMFSSTNNPQLDMLLDVTLQVSIELGRTDMSIKKILELGPGSIIELNRMAGEPVDLLVNDKVIAKGEVVVVDENFGIRIVKLVSPEERLKNLR